MKIILPGKFLLAGLLALSAFAVRADDEQSQFDILHSTASVSQKWIACQRLRVIGTAKAVPEVAALLTDPQLSQAARQTLDGLPYPEVDQALRDALGKTSGLLKAGIVDSIGWRGQPAAVPLLVPLLKDSDTNVAAAAGISLGRIGGKKAIAALLAARDNPPLSVQVSVQASLLQCAERLAAAKDAKGAASIYRKLVGDKYSVGIRTAAWRGLVLTDSAHQADLMTAALGGSDRALQRVALKVLREADNPRLVQACASQWDSLSPESKLAVIDAEAKQGAAGLSIVRTASQSPDAAVRIAAWKALGDLNDLTSVPALARAAAAGKGAERQAARDSLARLRGAGSSEALLTELKHAATPEKAELLRALGARLDANAESVLLENAGAGDEAVRRAALESLRELAPPDALAPLLDIAAKTDSDDVREQAAEVLSAICHASPDKDAAAKKVIEVQGSLPATAQAAFLPLLSELGTADALAAVQSASHSQSLDLAKEAVRVLAQWPNAAPANSLLDIARSATDPALRTLALRGAITVSAAEPSIPTRLAILKDALSQANRSDEKKEALSQLGQIVAPESLELAVKLMSDADVSNEAALAVVTIAEKLMDSKPELAGDAAVKVLEQHKDGELFHRAFALRVKRIGNAPFIRDWQICGPYAKQGVVGAKEVFNVPFGPEVRDQEVEWKAAASADHISLAEMFPGRDNCAAYLRTSIIVPADCSAVLLMGSDDGIKAWLNGAVIHANNVDRPEVIDSDVAQITLKKGANELVLKISQGGGGWSACARIVGTDGTPIPGLRVERPTGAAGSLIGVQ